MNVPATAMYASGFNTGMVTGFAMRSPGLWVPRAPGLGVAKSQLTSSILIGAGSALLKAAPTTGPAAPFVAAIGGIVMLGGVIAQKFKGCGATCIQATQYADEWNQILQQMKDRYFSTPVPRPRSFQQETLGQIQEAIDWLNQACGDPALGEAGKRCISERTVRGGTAPWCPTPDHKGCDVYTTLYDPIANDPNVIDDAQWSRLTGESTEPIVSAAGGGTIDWTPILIGTAVLLAVVVLAS